MRIGSGAFLYELVEGWGGLPAGADMQVIAGLGIDGQDNIYLLSRGKPAILVLDRQGNCLETWGDGQFGRPHALSLDRNEEFIFGVDDQDHTVYKFDRSHRLLQTIGVKGKAAEGGAPFDRPTNIAFAPNGDFYVTDGYGNARVHCFDAGGKLKFSWGSPGSAPGEFNLPHGIAIDKQGVVYVADRENNRIQLFTLAGEFLTEWRDFARPAGIFLAKDGLLYVAECLRTSRYDAAPSRVSILTTQGELLARLGQQNSFYDKENGHHCAHSIVVDSEGSFYIGEVGQQQPAGYIGLQKYRRIQE